MSKKRDNDSWQEGIINLPRGNGKTGIILIQYKGVQLTTPVAESHAAQEWLRSRQNESVHQIDCDVADRINYFQADAVLITSPTNARRPQITPPPGLFMEMVADFFCSKKTHELVVKPILADMQHEYFEALSQHRTRKAWLIRARYFWNFCMALGLMRILKLFASVWRRAN